MLKTTTFKQLDEYLQKRYESELCDKCETLRRAVSDNSKWEGNLDLTQLFLPSKARKFPEMVKLICFHWYFPTEVRFLFRLWIEDNLIVEYHEVLTTMLISKDMSLGYLLVQDLWSDRDLWGNIFSVKDDRPNFPWFNTKYLKFKKKVGKIKKVQRHRGYRDKGSRSFDHEKHGIPSFVIEEWVQEFLVGSQKTRGYGLQRRILERLKTERMTS